MYKNIYFIGIGGIGMSAIARYYKFKGCEVSGYDRTPSDLTRELEEEGIRVHYEDNIGFVPENVEETLVIYTPAIPDDMGELQYVRNRGYRLLKRSGMLGELTDGEYSLAVSGTHGKTTTSTLVAHILKQSGKGCSAFLGGISKNYGTNLLIDNNHTVVVEADEFDRSFHRLHPAIAVITAMDADHLDIYGDLEHVQEAFRIFASQVSDYLILKKGLPVTEKDTKAKIFTYHFSDPEAQFHAENLRLDKFGHYTFDLISPLGDIRDIRLGTFGWVNVENSVAAAAVCQIYGVEGESIREATGSFLGVRRRLDIQVNDGRYTYIDDYAHHPEELSTAVSSIRQALPGRKITAIFQPHLYTRTRDLADQFAAALSSADKLILLDIYPAREEPIPGVSSEMIFKDVTAKEKVLLRKEELMEYLEKEDIDVLVSFGAGNIDRFVPEIKSMLENR